MRWDRNYESSNIEDHRSEGGAGLGGLGGGGLALDRKVYSSSFRRRYNGGASACEIR